jgi:hypothetical protein
MYGLIKPSIGNCFQVERSSIAFLSHSLFELILGSDDNCRRASKQDEKKKTAMPRILGAGMQPVVE